MALPSSLKKLFKKIRKFILIIFFIQLVYLVALKWINPPITLTQLGSLFQGYGLKRDYIDKNEMSRYAGLAVMASEDQLFPEHNGFDLKSIKKALENNKKRSKRVRGASTISQQVAKNVFLWQGRSWVRKGFEVYYTFMIEQIWGKERILEMYLNVAEMGKGIFGIEAASRHYYKKPAKKLTRLEAAQIAAILPNPKKYLIKPLSGYVQRRSNWIQRQMNNLESDPAIELLIK
ncbi:MAG: monofunctional biosynthetic peptidoglycan transglycosylase [Cyclobacteriaceae bacterium]|nr:monofunctional biosynthetic peptidoglycan transglycosylase [Cyclobacteriaceae bacterium]